MFRTKFFSALLGSIAASAALAPQPAFAQWEPYIGQLMLFAGNFCPRGWAPAAGQILSIAQNTALFSLLGTTYGGNGQTTFALPDLRGRAPVNFGQGPGLSSYTLGQTGGAENFSIGVFNMPPHSHGVQATNADANRFRPGNKFLASNLESGQYHDGPPDRLMDPSMITPTGGGQPIAHRGPYLTLTWCVALEGVFPSRP